jgi:FMN phosphatase YigB (HAD superfamily)
MKYIFDFDDVLFYTNKKFIPYEYLVLEKLGVSRADIDEYYKKLKLSNIPFSMSKMLDNFSLPKESYDEVMRNNKNFINEDVLDVVKKIGRENCFIVTFGDEDFQRDKIKTAGIESLFSEIIVVGGSKKEEIEKICGRNKNEEVFFVDDKVEHLSEIDHAKCPNLKTILYMGQDLKSILLP